MVTSSATLSTFDCIAAITAHSAGFAEVARGNLSAPVEHCPGWSVADLVHHLVDVHWIWATIVEEQLAERPDESRRPPRVPDSELVDDFVARATHLVHVLRLADQSAACWTWSQIQRDVAFVTRHQVQEIVVHHWDAAHAAGGSLPFEPAVAADAVAEFLTFSVASDEAAADTPSEPLDGRFALETTDTGDRWVLTDGNGPGTVRVETEASTSVATESGTPTVAATAADLLLWLYGRVPLDTSAVPAPLVQRFRALCSTD